MKEKKNNEKKTTKKVLNKKLLTSAICFVLFIILTILVLIGLTERLDLAVDSYMISIRNDALTKFMIMITNIGGAYALISLTFLVILIDIIKQKKLPVYTMINLVSAFAISQIFKNIIRRARPTSVFLTHASGYSLPSGHTMVSFAFFAYIAYTAIEKINNKSLKLVIRILTTILIIMIGFSRIYLGVHYVTDIIAGYLLGASYLMLFINIRDNSKKRQKWK